MQRAPLRLESREQARYADSACVRPFSDVTLYIVRLCLVMLCVKRMLGGRLGVARPVAHSLEAITTSKAFRQMSALFWHGLPCWAIARDRSFGADSCRVVLSAKSSLFDPATSPIATSE